MRPRQLAEALLVTPDRGFFGLVGAIFHLSVSTLQCQSELDLAKMLVETQTSLEASPMTSRLPAW